jgi:hypothetical protein
LSRGISILDIVETNFYILLLHIFYIVGLAFWALLHNSIHCWNALLCIIRTLWHTLLEHLSVHFYIIPYIVGTQFYTLFYALFGLEPSRCWYNNPLEERVFCVLCTVPLLIICPQSENNGLGWGHHSFGENNPPIEMGFIGFFFNLLSLY